MMISGQSHILTAARRTHTLYLSVEAGAEKEGAGQCGLDAGDRIYLDLLQIHLCHLGRACRLDTCDHGAVVLM